MPVETRVTKCGNCGARVRPSLGQTRVQCDYCKEVTWLGPRDALDPHLDASPSAETTASPGLEALRGGPLPDRIGAATRRTASELGDEGAMLVAHALWPTAGHASSTFGGPWSPSAILGPPRVFPRSGDIPGAWAPGPSRSGAEWLEATFDPSVPVRAIRIYETHHAGSTYAVVDATRDGEILWASPPVHQSGAAVLEVVVDPPRPVGRVRVYLINPGWAEIDTIGLLAAAPLPLEKQTRTLPRPTLALSIGTMGVAFVGSIVAGIVLMVLLLARAGSDRRVNPSTPPRPRTVVSGSTIVATTPSVSELESRAIVWCSAVERFSSEYSSSQNGAVRVVGPPDVYPRHADLPGAWASKGTDDGTEWIEVRFEQPVAASQVVWVETLHPGAVVRVDDVSDPGNAAVLWEGTDPARGDTSAVLTVQLGQPREVRALRLVLDTARVAGWNEIDAIGLESGPAR